MNMLDLPTPRVQLPPRDASTRHAQLMSEQDPGEAAVDAAELLSSLLHTLDGLPLGLAVFEQSGRVLYANVAAVAALQRAGWGLSTGAWQSADPQQCRYWAHAVREVCQRSRRLLQELPADEGTAFVALSPLQCGRQIVAFATFGRAAVCGALELQLFSTHRGLTGAENRVLAKLAQGLKPADIAQQHGVGLSTVQTQLAAIRGKTGFSRVPDLLRQLSRLPPAQAVLNVA